MSARRTRTETPKATPSLGPTRRRRGPLVFAVEDTSAQLTWLEPLEPLRSRNGTSAARITTDPTGPVIAAPLVTARDAATGEPVGSTPYLGAPGSIELAGLAPATTMRIKLDLDGRPVGGIRLTTMASLGPELSRFATVSDVHLGLDAFGIRGRMIEREPTWSDPSSAGATAGSLMPVNLRAASSALSQLEAWGAQHLFVKGDLVDRSTPAAWALAGRLLCERPIPVTVMMGNHEHNPAGIVEPLDGAAAVGIEPVDLARRVDLPGLSVLCVDTIIPGVHGGRITEVVTEKALDLARSAPSPVIVLTHHPVERFERAWSYPPGVPRRQGEALIARLADACDLLMVSAGHTHAHRRRTIAGVTTTEVGSPKDFPGVWAGYVVCERGVRQVIRRVDAPHVNQWLHRTRLAAGGIWGRWSPGRLSDRSLQVRKAP